MKLQDIPLVMTLAEWIWGGDKAEHVSAEFCLSEFPFFSSGCFSQLLTKALGTAIILGSCLNKTPIMMNMSKNKVWKNGWR
jgi:hypothetical protein